MRCSLGFKPNLVPQCAPGLSTQSLTITLTIAELSIDMVEWKELFTTLMERGVDRVFLRVVLFIYQNQQCDVKWGGKYSIRFLVSNGVRQGAVSSPLLFSVYIDDLFKLLRNSGLGCHIANVFFACFGYADDLLLLSASRSGLQELVKICEKFAKIKGLTQSNPKQSA